MENKLIEMPHYCVMHELVTSNPSCITINSFRSHIFKLISDAVTANEANSVSSQIHNGTDQPMFNIKMGVEVSSIESIRQTFRMNR
jgi:hypothetical protein